MSDNTMELYDEENRLRVNISSSISENVDILKRIFEKCGDVVQKTFVIKRADGARKIHIIYIDGLTNNEMVEESILRPLSCEWREDEEKDFFDSILYKEAQTADIRSEKSFDLAVGSVLRGDTAIFVDGYNQALVVSTKKLPIRSISENDSEAGMRGPRDSFTESIRQSTALVRRRIRDSKLRVEQGYIGTRSRTDYAIMYVQDIAEPALVDEVRTRIAKYEIDAIFDSGMAEHLMEDNTHSPFPSFQATTRPDKVAAALVEGRVAVVFDNSPEVIIAPTNINMMLQAADDYYNRWAVASFARAIRYIAAIIAITLPGLYITFTVYHSEMLPTRLLYAVASARTRVTFPIVVEVLIMEFLFELLREAGIRLPDPLGNTIGVVGGLIVGESAVNAGIVSTMVVIIVALTAIASFAIPNEEFASVFRLIKFYVILASAAAGMYGFILALLTVVIHLSQLTSFGVPYMLPVAGKSKTGQELFDFIWRAPITKMKYRPFWSRGNNRVRIRRK